MKMNLGRSERSQFSDLFAHTYCSGCPLRALALVIYTIFLMSLLLDSFILATPIAGA
jgi:hypothetical protein